MNNHERYTVTAALPYANGPVHIGHLAGCYLPSDIYVRYLRSAGKDVLYICGSDEHGVAITIKARQEGMTPQQLVDKYDAQIRKAFLDFGLSFDVYSRTSSELHKETAQAFFLRMYEKGAFIKKVSTQFYDPATKMFLADRYIVGTCPNCGYEKAYGDQCEKCGTSLDPQDLINPKSALSGETPLLKETEHWYLPLQNHEEWLKQWLLEEHKDWKPNVIGQCRSWINQGLRERSISRDMNWGVPVPLPDAEGKVLYVWLDAPIGYITAAKEWGAATGNDWQPYWMDKENTKLVQFIGKDNIVFHCIIFPVMLNVHGDFILPQNVPANEFLNIESEKVSTSRNWAVWVHEYLEDFPNKQDVLRYVLTANMPETKDNDFTWKDFQARNNNELVAILGNLVNRVVILTHKYFQGKVPPKGTLGAKEAQLVLDIKAYPEKIAQNIRTYHFREGLSELMNLARAGNKYLAETEPWKTIKNDKATTATILHFALQLVANLAILSEPFLPHTAAKLKSALNMKNYKWDMAGKIDLLTEGTKIEQIGILFDKIEDDAIAYQIDKLQKGRIEPLASAQMDTNNKSIETPKENPAQVEKEVKASIEFEDFLKLDLRTGIIKEAELVPKTDKLLKLSVDLGSEIRTVVSGIAQSFNPAEIIGKQVVLVANLAPRKIKGIPSQGMILMTEKTDGKLVFIQPAEMIAAGSKIS